MIIHDILSHPTYSVVSFASKKSSKFLIAVTPSIPFLSSECSFVINGWLSFIYLSNIPSQPIIMKLSSGVLLYYFTSGFDMINC